MQKERGLEHPDHPTASSSLLNGAKSQDPLQWSRLVSTFGPIVYGWCRNSGVSEQDAADVVQNVFAAVLRGLPRFERIKVEGSFRSWLATITRNCIRDHFRALARQENAHGGTDAMMHLDQIPDPLESTVSLVGVEHPIMVHTLKAIEAEFEKTTWRAFWMTAVEERVPNDVAEELGISRLSVYQAKSRVLRRLRNRLHEIPE